MDLPATDNSSIRLIRWIMNSFEINISVGTDRFLLSSSPLMFYFCFFLGVEVGLVDPFSIGNNLFFPSSLLVVSWVGVRARRRQRGRGRKRRRSREQGEMKEERCFSRQHPLLCLIKQKGRTHKKERSGNT